MLKREKKDSELQSEQKNSDENSPNQKIDQAILLLKSLEIGLSYSYDMEEIDKQIVEALKTLDESL